MASLVADYGSSDNSSSNEGSDTEQPSPKQAAPVQEPPQKLPLPKFDPDGASPIKNSVFVNPFVEEENAKEAILEKHVKMIPAKSDVTNINGKKICWMYRKGRCRFGHNCRYAHDSDLHLAESNAEIGEKDKSSDSVNDNSVSSATSETPIDTSALKKKKKRPGLSQTLVPGKKVMNMYKKQKTTDSSPFIISSKK
ncbi:uncharacterized protein LOC111051905 [Nilaparvata lugens]|uniref:uncharacterized protein LOC111051905 n=1 Tax=Nilaparvata lugens TaxID=108931 RepID=UPI00193DB982|nr:uncharacterized protein LOC111051905 [Nilaparvata lugens]